MKKILCMILALMMLMVLCACDGQKKDDDQGGKKTSSTGETKPTPPANEDGKPVGFTFTYNGKQIGLNMKMDDVKALIGQPTKSNTSDSCAFNGTDTTHYYDSVRITTSDDRGYEWIYEITLTDDLVETEEGICIGASAADVTAKYGNSQGSSDALLVYNKDGMKLMFVITDGVVTAIRYTLL